MHIFAVLPTSSPIAAELTLMSTDSLDETSDTLSTTKLVETSSSPYDSPTEIPVTTSTSYFNSQSSPDVPGQILGTTGKQPSVSDGAQTYTSNTGESFFDSRTTDSGSVSAFISTAGSTRSTEVRRSTNKNAEASSSTDLSAKQQYLTEETNVGDHGTAPKMNQATAETTVPPITSVEDEPVSHRNRSENCTCYKPLVIFHCTDDPDLKNFTYASRYQDPDLRFSARAIGGFSIILVVLEVAFFVFLDLHTFYVNRSFVVYYIN